MKHSAIEARQTRGMAEQRRRARLAALLLVTAGVSLFGTACSPKMMESLIGVPRFVLGLSSLQVYYNDPGIDLQTGSDKKIDTKLIKLIEEAEESVDLAVYNLSRKSIIEAMTLAEERNLKVRMVGDVDEVVTDGYRSILRTRIPFSLGNSTAIMHDKYAVIDKKWVFMGTGNITDSGFLRNNNNFWIIESPEIARSFTREFEQMFYGKYGSKKNPLTTQFHYRVDFTPIDLYYSPYNGPDAMKRIIELINIAQRNIKYMIFAHTHDELSTAQIRAAKRGVLVRGIHDSTFVNGTSEEAPRLYGASQHLSTLQVRRDGNEHTAIVGVASHGGKLHTKTIIIDDAVVCTGSFNWSNNAVENNDENMICVHNPVLAQETGKQWQEVWDVSQPVTNLLRHPSGDAANPGDVVISEVMWAGGSPAPDDFIDKTDDWIELYNTTNHDIDVSHWSISWDENENVFYPIPDEYNWYKEGVSSRHYFTGRLIIPAKGHFLLKAQNNAINLYDNKVSGVKNFRLNESGFHIRLYDAAMTLIDEAGNGDPPVAGTYNETSFQRRAFSMERFFFPVGHAKAGVALPGQNPGSWYTSNGNNQSGSFVKGLYQVLGTFETGTIGTPRYSGNGSVADPSSVQSNAYGGFHGFTNHPIKAWATSPTQAKIQMRWALSSLIGPDDVPVITSAANNPCPAGTCTASLDADDPSVIVVNTLTQADQELILFAGSAAHDITGGFALGGGISFHGYGQPRATFRITQVGPRESKDLVELTVLTTGTANNLGIYHYKSEFDPTPPVLLYRMRDVKVTQGETVRLLLNSAASISDDDRCPTGCFSDTFDITAGGNATIWDLFSRELFLDPSDGILFLAYSLTETPMDIMCYSNRDGSVSEGLMQGGMRTLYSYPSSVYNLGVFPVAGNNDFFVQSACADYSGGTTAGDILTRKANNRNANDFSL